MHRFIYDNLITDASMITVSSLRKGIVTSAVKNGSGSATLTVYGDFTGSEDLEYTIEIDSVAGGVSVGQATFKWSDGGGSWDASGVTTPSVATELNNGVYVMFTAGPGDDFAVGDKWYFKTINLFNASRMLDNDRDSSYRSAALGAPNTITIDLGAAQEVKALIIGDHNFTAAATLLLEADDAATFDSDGGSAQFSEALTWNSGKIVHFLSAATTKRYWRISITDAANPDAYVEIGELFLGDYMELSRNYVNGFDDNTEILIETNKTPFGVRRDRYYNTQRTFEYDWKMIVAADLTKLRALVTAITDRDAGTYKPFWFCPASDSPNDSLLVKMDDLPIKHQFGGYYDVGLEMTEVVKSV